MFFEQNITTQLVLPAQSHALNLITHIWDYLNRQIRAQAVPDSDSDSEDLEELQDDIIKEWNAIRGETIDNVFQNVRRTIQAVIEASSRPTY